MVPPDRRRRRGIRALLALGLVGSLLASCSGDDPDDGRADDSVAVASASAVASDPPVVAGPRPKTAFDYIRELEIRPGSVDDFLIRDLLAVADSAQAHIA
ncbi:MAG TPA: hypothetical protein VNB94_02855, partial [Mycobacteriales bacterium]|nr:hypothetical protein [Mycobacteriales bacterium]